MRRIFLGLLIALLAFGVGTRLGEKNKPPPIIPSGSSRGVIIPGRQPMVERWEIFPSPLGATEQFNTKLQEAAVLMEFTPCFDGRGRRIGERAVMLILPAGIPTPTWRIMWTQQAQDFSESFWVESSTLSDASYFETVERQEWKKCIAKNKSFSASKGL